MYSHQQILPLYNLKKIDFSDKIVSEAVYQRRLTYVPTDLSNSKPCICAVHTTKNNFLSKCI